jgi:type VI secretion system protein ImpL
MQAIVGFLKRKLVVQLIGVTALCALIWFAGPLVTFANTAPFGPELNRLLAILAVIVVWLGYNLLMQARANEKDQQLIKELSASREEPSQGAVIEAQDEELVSLRQSFEEALRVLKETHAKGRRDRQYLYELPWYIITGPPGSGKTTLLSNSGLKFPLSERLGKSDFRGVGGTRNCDWFFAEEAIFLDTAGRYATQDSHQPVDEAGWRGFLDLIKKYRPRRPINGVVVALSMSDLLQQPEEARGRLARAIRQRTLELYDVFGIQFPIYFLFTKCDLIAGFSDFFADMGQEERAQVWGETFPDGDPKQTGHHIVLFDDHFEALLHRLNQRTMRRLQEERDPQRRGLILDFPQQMALLKPAIMRFLHDTFDINRFQTEPLLRGVYFTSATQEGTPIDRVMRRLAAAYGLDRQDLPVFSSQGKSFFITRLLNEVVFPEAELAGVDPRVTQRQQRLRLAAYAALLVLTVGMTALWWASYARNKGAIARVESHIKQYQEAKGTSRLEDGERALLTRLNILQGAYDVYEQRPWGMRLGLYQGNKLQAGIDHAYEQLLQYNLLPLIQRRLEERMLEHMRGHDASDLDILFELLKVYLMLGRPEKMDTRIASAWIQKEWERSFALEPQIQTQFRIHLNNLLNWRAYEPIRLNDAIVANARRKLNAIPSALQLYAHLKSETIPDHSHDFRLHDVLGPRAQHVFGQGVQTMTIPGLYTYHGYHDVFKAQGLEFVEAMLARNWILQNPNVDQSHDVRRLYEDLQTLYFADYATKWRNLLNALHVKQPQSIDESIQTLDLLSSGPDSLLHVLLEAVKKNTSLATVAVADTPGRQSEPNEVGEQMSSLAKAQGAWQNDMSPKPVRDLERRFEDLNNLVRSSGNYPPPLDNVHRLLRDVRGYMMQISLAAENQEEALRMFKEQENGASANDVLKKAEIEFRRLPDPLNRWLPSLTSFGQQIEQKVTRTARVSEQNAREAELRELKSELNAAWKTDVLPSYRIGLDRRYPLFPDSQNDATIADFSRFFAPNGVIEQFFQNRLKPFIDQIETLSEQTRINKHAIGLSGEVLQQFQYAERIRKTFFAAGGSTPSVQFELKPISMDTTAARFELNIEGQTTEYAHDPPRSKTFRWPGPQPAAGVRLWFRTLDGKDVFAFPDGPWAWLRTLNEAIVQRTGLSDRFRVMFQVEGYKAQYELRAMSVDNPFNLAELQRFRCPESM